MADGSHGDVDEGTEPMLGANVRAWLFGELSPSELGTAAAVGWESSTEALALAYLLAANGDWGRFAAALLSLAGVAWRATFGAADGVARALRHAAIGLRAGGALVVPVVHLRHPEPGGCGARAAETWRVVDRAVVFALETERDPTAASLAFPAALAAISSALPIVGPRMAASELRRGGAPRRFRPTARDELLAFFLHAAPELHP